MTSTWEVWCYGRGGNGRIKIGSAVLNRDSTISIRLDQLKLPFDGRLLLEREIGPEERAPLALDFDHREANRLRAAIAPAQVKPLPPPPPTDWAREAAEGAKVLGRFKLKDPQPPKREPYLAVRCDCQGTKPGHQKIQDSTNRPSAVCSVPAGEAER